jgi:hypothetical protein
VLLIRVEERKEARRKNIYDNVYDIFTPDHQSGSLIGTQGPNLLPLWTELEWGSMSTFLGAV